MKRLKYCRRFSRFDGYARLRKREFFACLVNILVRYSLEGHVSLSVLMSVSENVSLSSASSDVIGAGVRDRFSFCFCLIFGFDFVILSRNVVSSSSEETYSVYWVGCLCGCFIHGVPR